MNNSYEDISQKIIDFIIKFLYILLKLKKLLLMKK